MVGPLSYWEDVLNASGGTFRLIDRGVVANVTNAIGIDKNNKTVIYAGQKDSFECTIAYHRYPKVRDELVGLNSAIAVY
ncbi:hypothetical protein D3C80_2116050 [compost metagenome]